MLWVIFALIGSLFWAVANILDKVLRTKYMDSSLALAAAFGIPGMAISLVLFTIIGVPAVSPLLMFYSFASGILLPIVVISYIKALSLEEASRVVPLWHISPLLTIVLAVLFLDEILTPLSYMAFALILTGGFLVSARKIGNVLHLSPALAYMFLSSFFVAIADVLLKYIFTQENFWQILMILYFGINISSLSIFLLPKVRKDFKNAFKAHRLGLSLLIPVSSILGFFGHIFYNRAILLGPVSLVSVFVGFQSLFVLVIAAFLSVKLPMFIKESLDLKTMGAKTIAIMIMMAGLYLLGL
ncbi:EamA family transporter [Candidatus Woesearchaeota archaeon]|nr:EamA family transporter [Candidatus Woesearchaeota archaeon]